MKSKNIPQQPLIPNYLEGVLKALDCIDSNTLMIFKKIYITHIKNQSHPGSKKVSKNSRNIVGLNGVSNRNNGIV